MVSALYWKSLKCVWPSTLPLYHTYALHCLLNLLRKAHNSTSTGLALSTAVLGCAATWPRMHCCEQQATGWDCNRQFVLPAGSMEQHVCVEVHKGVAKGFVRVTWSRIQPEARNIVSCFPMVLVHPIASLRPHQALRAPLKHCIKHPCVLVHHGVTCYPYALPSSTASLL
eukprot:GHRR01019891.1.p1 GENE.GHRR01019891.1~~GHRR01019891.1.p1  ORF type:complete len:170 (+),score=29.46 GHRR01019891.1:1788-2297(+)